MGIKRFFAEKDNTITNAFEANLTTRGTGSNMGAADILEVFSIYAQASSSAGLSNEKSRAIIQFPVDDITNARSTGQIPASGSVSFYLKLANARHGQTLPKGFTLVTAPVSGAAWTEGEGLDMENYSDIGVSNWISASEGVGWQTEGGDYYSASEVSQLFDKGTEDLEINVTSIVEDWIAGTVPNYGFGVFLTSSEENSTSRSYYTKKFFSRTSEFFFKRPVVEARFNATVQDDRGNFFYSSSLASAEENLNTIYLYNRVRGRLRNIPSIGTGNIYVSVFSGSTEPTGSAIDLVADGTHVLPGDLTVVTGEHVSTGIYKATFAATAAATPLDTLFDVWHNSDLTVQFKTGSITPLTLDASSEAYAERYINKITNLKPEYFTDETARFRVYTRPRNWQPNIYTVAQQRPETTIIPSSSFSVYRIADDQSVIPFGTGSDLHTVMSYDSRGNYFDLDISMLEPDYAYGIELCHYNDYTGGWDIQEEVFKFRVEKRQTK
jgi:hypothetical protein